MVESPVVSRIMMTQTPMMLMALIAVGKTFEEQRLPHSPCLFQCFNV